MGKLFKVTSKGKLFPFALKDRSSYKASLEIQAIKKEEDIYETVQ